VLVKIDKYDDISDNNNMDTNLKPLIKQRRPRTNSFVNLAEKKKKDMTPL